MAYANARTRTTLWRAERHGFYNLLENKVHRLNIPNDRPWRRCCGSSQGWLVLLEERDPTILLFNPLTKIQVQLPPLTAFPNVLNFDIRRVGKEYLLQSSLGDTPKRHSSDEVRDFFIKKVVLSTSPTSLSQDYVAVAIVDMTMELAFCKKGDTEWTMIKDASCFYDDVIYYEGVFYAVHHNGSFTICDVSGPSPSVEIIKLPSPVRRRGVSHAETLYLVDLFGELLMVYRLFDPVRAIDNRFMVYETIGFKVVRLNSRRTKWVNVENLGDRMLFLGTSSSLCLLAPEFPGCDGNCIYFTGEFAKPSYDQSYWNHDSGIFNLGDGSMKGLPYCTGGRSSFFTSSRLDYTRSMLSWNN
ncbi:Protein of unknown function DUF295 [Macleaya cordata]|uniref:KIB1-4 beta-propeller domain-containing protein n=1 Tax=Macleaya cordata TaxID=56857 RepID=A0A200QK51_MACCD|nr:Protein of unknown function DUF295 [Macleaya cordata]